MNTRGMRLGYYLVLIYILQVILGKTFLEHAWGPMWIVSKGLICTLTAVMFLYLAAGAGKGTAFSGNANDYRRVRLFLLLFLAWGLTSACVQEQLAVNLMAYAVFSGMVILLGLCPMSFLRRVPLDRPVVVLSAIICLGAIASLVALATGFPSPTYQGRLCGIYNGSITAARLTVLGAIVILWRLSLAPRKYHVLLLMLAACVITVFLAQSRSTIVALGIGIIPIAVRASYAKKPLISGCMVLGFLLCLSVALVLSLGVAGSKVAAARKFLRIERPLRELPQERMRYWEKGLDDLRLTNVIGQGYLASFGGGAGGFKESGYDIELNRHNAFLACAQSYGVVGLAMWVAFLLTATFSLVSRRDPLATLALAVMGYGLTISVTTNWLLSFGSPVDAVSWFILGVALAPSALNGICYRPTPVLNPRSLI